VIAFHVAYHRCVDVEEAIDQTWSRIAFVCRYGHIGLDALAMPGTALNSLMHAIGKIVAEENAANTK
jgi:hypothetical protein